jgi:hypothetical protein
VKDGVVTFLPADGKGPPASGSITNGRYSLTDIRPGPKVVQIAAVKAVPFARNSEDMARRAAANKARGDGSGIIDPADVIPQNAEGNNVQVEVKPGPQTLDLSLKGPGSPNGR